MKALLFSTVSLEWKSENLRSKNVNNRFKIRRGSGRVQMLKWTNEKNVKEIFLFFDAFQRICASQIRREKKNKKKKLS